MDEVWSLHQENGRIQSLLSDPSARRRWDRRNDRQDSDASVVPAEGSPMLKSARFESFGHRLQHAIAVSEESVSSVGGDHDDVISILGIGLEVVYLRQAVGLSTRQSPNAECDRLIMVQTVVPQVADQEVASVLRTCKSLNNQTEGFDTTAVIGNPLLPQVFKLGVTSAMRCDVMHRSCASHSACLAEINWSKKLVISSSYEVHTVNGEQQVRHHAKVLPKSYLSPPARSARSLPNGRCDIMYKSCLSPLACSAQSLLNDRCDIMQRSCLSPYAHSAWSLLNSKCDVMHRTCMSEHGASQTVGVMSCKDRA
ncbi:unnamed protein product [Prunus brigantina]